MQYKAIKKKKNTKNNVDNIIVEFKRKTEKFLKQNKNDKN